ncbi:hypothetical protein [Limnohabitans sp.]|uniref:hypothetical protein n=1 Tax=Limnohabitans sp. TaxID=1907725 RepID=UPI0038BB5D99
MELYRVIDASIKQMIYKPNHKIEECLNRLVELKNIELFALWQLRQLAVAILAVTAFCAVTLAWPFFGAVAAFLLGVGFVLPNWMLIVIFVYLAILLVFERRKNQNQFQKKNTLYKPSHGQKKACAKAEKARQNRERDVEQEMAAYFARLNQSQHDVEKSIKRTNL